MRKIEPRFRVWLSLGVLLLLALSACDSPTGGGGTTGIVDGQRSLPAGFTARKAVAYSGFRTATAPANRTPADVPSAGQIKEDLDLLVSAGFGLIRLFDSSDNFSKVVLQTIQDNSINLKVQLGIWISGSKALHDAENQAEIARGVALAKTFSSLVWTVSVGNETMVNWGMGVPVQDMKNYLTSVRSQITQPVTTDDNWAFFANDGGAYSTAAILSAIDYISIHTYPYTDSIYSTSSSDNAYWDWYQTGSSAASRATAMMDAALGKAKKDYNAVAAYAQSKGFGSLPIIVGETGWKSVDSAAQYRPHPVNQKMYFDRLQSWTDGPKAIFYFEAFDEPWKSGDDNWGLFDVNRLAKYVLYSSFPSQKESAVYSDSDAVYYIPLQSNGTITTNKYLVYADTMTSDSTTSVPSGPQLPLTSWIGWDSPWTATGSETTASGSDTSSEGSKYMHIVPNPASWGWGFFLSVKNPEDLSNFNNGTLHFSLRTTYPGKIEIGFFTGATTNNTGCDVYIPVTINNDGSWHDVSVSVSDLRSHAAPAYGQPNSVTINMAQITQAFVIADRYGNTGKSQNAHVTTALDIDNIYWTQN